jgi:hypothetical protein
MRSAAAGILAAVAVSGACVLFAFAACSSDDSGASPDASIGPAQPLGAPCDPTLTAPCSPSPSPCAVSVCTDGVCTELLVDASAVCLGEGGVPLPPVNGLCATSSDCEAGTLCGFLAVGGCSITGVCVLPLANGSLPPPACGCSGQSDPYITNDFTAAPASSPGACVDGGPDAGGGDGGDAASPADGSSSADASDGAPE